MTTLFDYCSDLHIDFDRDSLRVLDCFPDNRSPVLILAGDILELDVLYGRPNAMQKQANDFFMWVSQHYDTVLMIMGNHEYYRGVLNAEIPKLRAFFVTQGISNIHILENQTYEFDDALVFGTSLWTSCRNNNPVIKHAVQNGLVDYKRISVINESGEKSLITPEDTISLHYLAMQALHNFLQVPTQKRRIVLTHFAPHILSIEPCYKKYLTTDGYYEELYELIANSDVNTWVHGHTHFPVDYTIENTRVISNPRGYYGSEPTAMRFKVKSF